MGKAVNNKEFYEIIDKWNAFFENNKKILAKITPENIEIDEDEYRITLPEFLLEIKGYFDLSEEKLRETGVELIEQKSDMPKPPFSICYRSKGGYLSFSHTIEKTGIENINVSIESAEPKNISVNLEDYFAEDYPVNMKKAYEKLGISVFYENLKPFFHNFKLNLKQKNEKQEYNANVQMR